LTKKAGRPPGIKNGEGKSSELYARPKKEKLPFPLRYSGKLSLKEQCFVDEVVKNPNISSAQAAINAGYPEGSAAEYGRLLMRTKRVQDALASYNEVVSDEVLVDKMRVMEETAAIAFGDPRQVPGFPDMPYSVARTISSITMAPVTYLGKPVVDQDGKVIYRTSVQFWNKNTALDQLFRHLGLYEQDNKQKPAVQLNQLVQQMNLNIFSNDELEFLVNLGDKLKSGQNEQKLLVVGQK